MKYAEGRKAHPGRTCATCGKRTAYIGSHAYSAHVRYDAPQSERDAAYRAAKGQAPR